MSLSTPKMMVGFYVPKAGDIIMQQAMGEGNSGPCGVVLDVFVSPTSGEQIFLVLMNKSVVTRQTIPVYYTLDDMRTLRTQPATKEQLLYDLGLTSEWYKNKYDEQFAKVQAILEKAK